MNLSSRDDALATSLNADYVAQVKLFSPHLIMQVQQLTSSKYSPSRLVHENVIAILEGYRMLSDHSSSFWSQLELTIQIRKRTNPRLSLLSVLKRTLSNSGVSHLTDHEAVNVEI